MVKLSDDKALERVRGASDLRSAGERLYGEHWRQPLARWLGVHPATLRRWCSEEIAVPEPVLLAIRLRLELVERRARAKLAADFS
jgi:hypothetical protein